MPKINIPRYAKNNQHIELRADGTVPCCEACQKAPSIAFRIESNADGVWPFSVSQGGPGWPQASDSSCIVLDASHNAKHLIGRHVSRQVIENLTDLVGTRHGWIAGVFVRDEC